MEKEISTSKITSFVYGRQKKSAFQVAKEQREQKRRQEQEETAKIYDSFVKSFDTGGRERRGGAEGVASVFVSGGTLKDGSLTTESQTSSRAITVASKPVMKSGSGKSFFDDLIAGSIVKNEVRNREEGGTVPDRHGQVKKAAALAFVEGISENAIDTHGSFDNGDPSTSNLYIGNLASSVSEDVLHGIFGKFGKIDSVKVMWPRGDQVGRRKNSGFVSFDRREDAAAALAELQGEIIHGVEIKLGWGKALKTNTALKGLLQSFQPMPMFSGDAEDDMAELDDVHAKVIRIAAPQSNELRRVIDRLAEFVVRDGPPFEEAMLNNEAENPLYDFLRDPTSDDALYYRWKVFSLAQGDSTRSWKELPFKMFIGGCVWEPPKFVAAKKSRRRSRSPKRRRSRSRSRSRDRSRDRSSSRSTDEEERSRRRAERARDLTSRRVESKKKDISEHINRNDRNRLRQLLDTLSMERDSIGDAMCFCMERADAAEYIVRELARSLLSPDATAPAKVARLYLASDLLHNSGAKVKNASLFRTHLMVSIPEVFESLRATHAATASRLTASTLRDRVNDVLKAWEAWSIFSDAFLFGLEATMMASEPSGESLKDFSPHSVSLELLQRECKLGGLSVAGTALDMKYRLERTAQHRRKMRPAEFHVYVPELVVGDASGQPGQPGTELRSTAKQSVWAVVEHAAGGTLEEEEEDIDGIPYTDSDSDIEE